MLTEQKFKLFIVAGNMEETWIKPATFSHGGKPPHSHMEEGPKCLAVLIPIFHHNNLQFSVFIRHNNDSGALFED